MSGQTENLPSVETANSTENMEKVEKNDPSLLTEAPKDSATADNLTQKNSTNDNNNNNNNGEPIMAAVHLLQNPVYTESTVVSDTSGAQLMETENDPSEQNEKPNDMKNSLDAPTMLTAVQDMDTNQMEQDEGSNNIENPLDVPKTPLTPQKDAKDDIMDQSLPIDSRCQFRAEQSWVDLKFHSDNALIKKPDELVPEMKDPPNDVDTKILNRIKGSMFGMALGDALGAHVEFRPQSYLKANPVTDLESGGTWGLEKGQFTDDTSMALCLANSLVARHGFNPYDHGQITHGDKKSYDSCRYYGALIVAAMQGANKAELLDDEFYSKHQDWFSGKSLVSDVMKIAKGSYKRKGGYDEGIRGKGYIVSALEAALWAFWSDDNSFEKGALAAVNLGDDTDTTAAIYGQLAGAYYGYDNLSPKWRDLVYAKDYITYLSKWIAFEAEKWVPCEEDKWNLTKLSALNADPPPSDSKPNQGPSLNTNPKETQKFAPLSQNPNVISSTTESETSNVEDVKIELVPATDEDIKTKTTSLTSEPGHTAKNISPQSGGSIVLSSTEDKQSVCLESVNIEIDPTTEGDIMTETTSSTSTPGHTSENKSEVPSTSVEPNVCLQPGPSSEFTDIMSAPEAPTSVISDGTKKLTPPSSSSKGSFLNRTLEFLKVTDTEIMYDSVMQMTIDAFTPLLGPLASQLKQTMNDCCSYEAVKYDLAKLYMEEFTLSDMNRMIRFYSSPVGQKLIKKQPILMIKAKQLGQRKAQEYLPKFQAMIQEQLNKQINNLKK
ncbi:unnamed protein product [Rotaria sordida]|uniref:ADP-ribosylhydrolase ARH3 n=1 Tax=Rotaria sordida TaxID=392033 RepID=A0A815EDU0_9BILA|nr:unnamed protein product [Rotaria sordida]